MYDNVEDRSIVGFTRRWRNAIIVACAVVAGLLAVYILWFRLQQESHLYVADGNFYAAVADGILSTGKALNMMSLPPSYAFTPQLGVTYIHVVLGLLGLDLAQRLQAIVVINFLLYLSSAYPLYKIARRMGIGDIPTLTLLLTMYVGAWNMYRFVLWPLNDGAFYAMSLWLLYLLMLLLDDDPALQPRRRLAYFSAALLLCATMIHFRLQTVDILIAALAAVLLVRKFKLTFWPAVLILGVIGSLALMVLATGAVDSILDTADRRVDFGLVAGEGGFLAVKLAALRVWMTQVIPAVLFRDLGMPLNLIYIPFVAAVVAAMVLGIRSRNFPTILIAFACCAALAAAVLIMRPLSRYLQHLFPLLFLLVFWWKPTRPIGYLFAVLVIMSSLAKFRYVNNIPSPEFGQLAQHIRAMQITLPEESILLSLEGHSHYYAVLGPAYVGDLSVAIQEERRPIYVLGPAAAVSSMVERVEKLGSDAGIRFEAHAMTSEYSDSEGRTLIHLERVDVGR